jgi:hypothetical protein
MKRRPVASARSFSLLPYVVKVNDVQLFLKKKLRSAQFPSVHLE